MILIDSSAWIAYFTDQACAKEIENHLSKRKSLLVPSVVLYEVYRYLKHRLDPQEALFFVSQLQDVLVIPLDGNLALYAADISRVHKLSMADAIIYATALDHDAEVITLDNDFRELKGCKVIA